MKLRTGLLATSFSLVALVPAAAQNGGDGFLFHQPVGSLAVRFGYNRASASGDVLSFVRNELTLDRGDFDAFTGAADFAARITSRVDLVFGASYSKSNSPSEFRAWVDQNNQPIEQTTSFTRTPVTASARFFLLPRGRQIGQLAWIPSRFAPYVGAGGGVMWYQLHQNGDFVDAGTLRVFHDDFTTSGRTGTLHAFFGADMALSTRFSVTAEGRYAYAKGPVSGDYLGFHSVDLSGFSFTMGLAFMIADGHP